MGEMQVVVVLCGHRPVLVEISVSGRYALMIAF
jgi:hypothetical protein